MSKRKSLSTEMQAALHFLLNIQLDGPEDAKINHPPTRMNPAEENVILTPPKKKSKLFFGSRHSKKRP